MLFADMYNNASMLINMCAILPPECSEIGL